jgi:hypothetical protein
MATFTTSLIDDALWDTQPKRICFKALPGRPIVGGPGKRD